MKGAKITIWFIALALAIIIIYDLLALTQYNVDATISRVVYWWAEYSFLFKYLFIAGVNFLMGHLLWGQRVMSKGTKELLEIVEKRPDSQQLHISYFPWWKQLIDKAREVREGK